MTWRPDDRGVAFDRDRAAEAIAWVAERIAGTRELGLMDEDGVDGGGGRTATHGSRGP